MTSPINYYEELDSFAKSKSEAKKFEVIVQLKSGPIFRSTAMPISFLPQVIASLEVADAARTAITLWNREDGNLTMIPHLNIDYVSIALR